MRMGTPRWSRSRSVRLSVLAFLLLAGAMFASWVVPGLTWQGVHRVLAQPAPAVQADSQTVTAPQPPTSPPASEPPGVLLRLRGLLGIVAILAIAIALSHNRKQIRWRVVAWGLGLQLLFAIFVLRIPAGQQLFRALGSFVTSILNYSYVGSQFVFGELGKPNSSLGVIFAFQLLPAIIFVSALFAIMYYLGIMQLIVRAFAILMSRVMGASGAESLNVAASIFMGQTEAPLTIRPFLPRMTRSELMTVMTSGMAHISGSIMVAYIAFGIEARHLLTAVIMTAPGTIMMAKLFEPETEVPETYGKVKLDMPKQDVNLLDAAARGTSEGLNLMLNVIAMLVSFVALVALLNGGFRRHSPLCRMVSVQSPDRARLGLPADRLAHGRALARQRHDREPVGHPHGVKRVHRLRRAGTLEGAAGSAVIHHRVVRPGGVRQLQLGRYPARRDRRIGARAQTRPRPARHSRDARRHAGEFSVGDDRGDSVVKTAESRSRPSPGEPLMPSGGDSASGRPTVAVVLGSGLGFFTQRIQDPVTIPYRDIPGFPEPTVIGHGGELVAGRLGGEGDHSPERAFPSV